MHKSYYQMVDAVNEATTERDHAYAEARLSGWIECAEYFGLAWSGIAADRHTEHKYGDRPMCCGVLLDWMPNANVTGLSAAKVRVDGSVMPQQEE